MLVLQELQSSQFGGRMRPRRLTDARQLDALPTTRPPERPLIEAVMSELFFGGNAVWFSVPALVGTSFLIVRLVLMFLAAGDDFDLQADDDPGFDIELEQDDSSSAFKILSIQTISTFLMGFGWGGLGAFRGSGLPALVSVPVAVAVGAGMVWLLGRLFGWIARFQSSGTLGIGSALFEEGTVYIAIPPGRSGRGRVRVIVNDRMQYYSAVTNAEEIPSKTKVRVTAVNEDNTLTVDRLQTELPQAGA